MEPNIEKKPESDKERILTFWFAGILLVPFAVWYISGVDITLTGAISFWIVNVGIPVIVASIIQLLINLTKKRRPLISINQQFLVLATGLVVTATLLSLSYVLLL